ncbi:hypothetical protein IFM89_033493 [Coptis chinensis]|uniref:Uncharacterized protein n=1 Tax=Coptis chinensis TaxID=261450 RepID=A0A835M1H8_9MAGN|nr:hypothetical protein IFM89_033493 [Coptis chinensis]
MIDTERRWESRISFASSIGHNPAIPAPTMDFKPYGMSQEQWEINEEDDRILPPELRRKPGRPPMERIKIPPTQKGPK